VKERVQKLMAQANIGSRRACEELIRQGRVKVNGEVVTLGTKADPKADTIVVDGDTLNLDDQQKVYIALNKPTNVVSSNRRHKGDDRQTARQLIPIGGHLFTIGRLDAESQGLMVFTNDGELANRLSHPRYRHTKTYRAIVYGLPKEKDIEQWEQGVFLGEEEGMSAACSVRVVKASKGLATLEIIMTEGKKRQIRRVASQLGFPVRHLTRTHIGKLGLGTLRPGDWRELTEKDIQLLRAPDPVVRQLRQNKNRKPRPPRRR
jgi:pseudouridine synthase